MDHGCITLKGVHPRIVNQCLNLNLKDFFISLETFLAQRFLHLCEAAVGSPGLERDYVSNKSNNIPAKADEYQEN